MNSFCRWGVAIAIVCAFLLAMLAATPASAQTFRGSILGTVTDSERRGGGGRDRDHT